MARYSSLFFRSTAQHTRLIQPAALSLSPRYYHSSQSLAYAFKHQDRHSLDPSRSETTQTASDDDVAHKDEAFDPNETDPHKEQEKSKDSQTPLDVSPSDETANRVPPQKDMGKDKSTERKGISGKGEQNKAGGPQE